MQSNNPILGDDQPRDDDQSFTEQPTADAQDQPELMATDDQPVQEEPNEVLPTPSERRADEETGAEDAGEDDVIAAVEESAAVDEDAVAEEPTPLDEDAAAVEEAAVDEAPSAAEPGGIEQAVAEDDSGDDRDEVDRDEDDDEDRDDDDFDEVDGDDEEETVEELGAEAPAFRKGQIVDGTVLETSPTEVLVDLGEGHTGVVASRELERMDRAAIEALSIGSPVTAFVLKARGTDGRPVLSLARAEEEKNWRLAEEHHQNQEVYFSKVAGYNKGGLIVRFGKVRGFVPASQVSRDRQRSAVGESPEERWGRMVGDDIAVKVVEIDRGRNRLILSERAAAREWRDQQKSRLLKDLAVGEIRKGRVISVADFGAFVDLGGADGLVHLTEISWKHVTHPREVLEVGQEVEVEVISVDPDRKRIGLSMKRREHDPWDDVVAGYQVGQLAQATVTKLTKFGAFARLVDAPEIEGLIHISELADYRVSHPREVVLVGDVLTLRIVKIDAEQRRLGLSLRQVDSAKFMDQDWLAYADDYTGDTAEAAPTAEAAAPEAPEAEPEIDVVEDLPADTVALETDVMDDVNDDTVEPEMDAVEDLTEDAVEPEMDEIEAPGVEPEADVEDSPLDDEDEFDEADETDDRLEG